MARIESASCSKCGEPYTYVEQPHVWRRANVCGTCETKERDAKVLALKNELARVAPSPILQLLAEITVLRTTLIESGKIDAVRHFEQVVECAKQIGGIDGKAHQTRHPAPTGSQDPQG
jgi:hypothetical protein